MRKTGPTNEHMQSLIQDLRRESYKQEVGLWKRIAQDLAKPSRQRKIVNLSRINRNTKDNETIIVPGKVLGSGELNHSITIAAFDFSGSAKSHIEKAKGSCLSIRDLMKKNPKGKDVRILA